MHVQAAKQKDDAMMLLLHLQPQTLRFKVCNGFANQRLAVMYGVLLAVKTGRSPVVPVLIGEGTQSTTQEVSSAGHGARGVDAGPCCST